MIFEGLPEIAGLSKLSSHDETDSDGISQKVQKWSLPQEVKKLKIVCYNSKSAKMVLRRYTLFHTELQQNALFPSTTSKIFAIINTNYE